VNEINSYLETDGKAGMAVILDDPSAPMDMNILAQDLRKEGLPSYARPCFIRLTKHIELTGKHPLNLNFPIPIVFPGTFKVKKTVFQEEAFDLNRVTEPIYYLNTSKQTYERLTPEIYQFILQEKIKF
jgi:hypothetical protein